ncbi:MAG: 50S ribosomal protein L19e [Candidatus Njordarchaeia archaeon]
MTKSLAPQRRIAASVLKVGENRVWMDPEALEDVEKALTREDIRKLVKERKIWKRPVKGVSRHRARFREMQRRKGRRRGPGKKKGSKSARMGGTMVWVIKIRAIRKILRQLKDEEVITRRVYNHLRRMAKAGFFRNKAHVITYIQERRLNVKPLDEFIKKKKGQ